MLAALLFVAAVVVAEPPAGVQATTATTFVQVRFVYTDIKGETSAGVEPWIVKHLSKKGEVLVSMSEWVTLSSEDQRVCEANGMFVDGKANERDGGFVVQLSGCAGFEIKRKATIKPGEQAVYLMKGTRSIFVAIRTFSYIVADERSE